MRKPDLAVYIANRADLSAEQAQQVMAAILDHITLALSRDDSVSLVGFGTFEKRHRNARAGKNPQTGAAIDIAASNTVGFKPGKALRDALG
jgi:DNA-binding protein HU-alpha